MHQFTAYLPSECTMFFYRRREIQVHGMEILYHVWLLNITNKLADVFQLREKNAADVGHKRKIPYIHSCPILACFRLSEVGDERKRARKKRGRTKARSP